MCPEGLPSTSRSEGHPMAPPVPQDGQVAGAPEPRPLAAQPGPLGLHLRLPVGLEDVSKYPNLVAELLRRQWTEAEVRGALADNLLRVFEAVEQVRLVGAPALPSGRWQQAANPVCLQASNHARVPEETPIEQSYLDRSCRTSYGYSAAPGLHLQPAALLASLTPLLLGLLLL